MLKFLSSPRITVICLFLLFILTFWGTVAQVQQGLYAAQERYFNSFFFLSAGFIPFPGAQLVLWVLFINLMAMMILNFKRLCQRQNAGLLVIHVGLILYFVAAFMVFHVAKESHVRLAEGQSASATDKFALPFTLRLDDFKAEFHPGTAMAKSFESMVTVTTGNLERPVRIYMNNPFRYKDYTVYQASYDIDTEGREYSTLAVVKNSVRLLPYIACFVVFFGLALHFLIRAFSSKVKR